MEALENECQISQNGFLHMKFLDFYLALSQILVKFDIYFLGLPLEIFFGVITNNLLHLSPLKNLKENVIFFKLFGYTIFVH